MKKLGFIFIAVSLGIGFISSIYPYSKCFYAGIGLAIAVFVSGIWAFMLHCAPEELGMPKYENPPAPPKKTSACLKDAEEASIRHALRKDRGITIIRPEFPKDRN